MRDVFRRSQQLHPPVIPTKAVIQCLCFEGLKSLDYRLRGNDESRQGLLYCKVQSGRQKKTPALPGSWYSDLQAGATQNFCEKRTPNIRGWLVTV